MQIIERVEDIKPVPCAVAVGNFDGLHIGHMQVIAATVNTPGLLPVLLTFQENSHMKPMLLTNEEKARLIEGAGIKKLINLPFESVRDLSAEAFFLDVLIKRCGAKKILCGTDFRFGYAASGDTELLEKLCRESGTELELLPFALEGGRRVSSTQIRSYVADGEIVAANRMLGRPFGFELEVIHGNHIGTGLGTPTINQAFPDNFVLAKFGVYASAVRIDGKHYYGVTNIGVKPTVGSDRVLSETWMPDFSGDLYGKTVKIKLLDFIRPERRFDSLAQMKEEILKNAEQAREIVGKWGK